MPEFPTVPGVVLEAEIGRGGFATVYRAHQLSVDRKVAVKVDDRRLVDDRDRRRYTREITAAGRVSAHPHIVTVYDGGTTADQRPYLVMELCPGGSYGARIKRTGPVPLPEVLDVGFGIADALVAAHAEGVLHRDVKPGNILITRYGTAALADFGLAALPAGGDQPSVTLESLTPSYAPPEAFSLRPPTESGDVYSLGATLYALLQGRPPRSDSTGSPPTVPRLLMLLNEPLPPLDVPGSEGIMQVLWKATAPDPERRYRSAAEFRDALAAVRLGRGPHYGFAPAVVESDGDGGGPPGSGVVGARPRPPDGPVTATGARSRPRRRNLVALLIGVLVAAIVAVGTILIVRAGNAVPGSAGTSAGTSGGAANQTASTLESTPAPATTETGSVGPTTRGGDSSGSAATSDGAATRSSADGTSSAPSSVSTAAAGAPPVGTCFGGITTINVARTSSQVPCRQEHYWEAFATGVLSDATTSPYLDEVVKDPAVKKTCSKQALKSYLRPGRKGTFQIEVLPPREFDFLQGRRGFWCLAAEEGKGVVVGSLRSGG